MRDGLRRQGPAGEAVEKWAGREQDVRAQGAACLLLQAHSLARLVLPDESGLCKRDEARSEARSCAALAALPAELPRGAAEQSGCSTQKYLRRAAAGLAAPGLPDGQLRLAV
jgi:hypothetical protein